MAEQEISHIHGTPLVSEPQSVKELFKWAAKTIADLEARIFSLENVAPSPAPPPEDEGPTVQ